MRPSIKVINAVLPPEKGTLGLPREKQ